VPQYATISDLRATGVTSKALVNVPDASLSAALTNASAMLDGALGSQFTLPLITWDEGLKQRTIDVATYLVLKTRGFNMEEPADRAVVYSWREAMQWMQRVGAGLEKPTATDSSPTGYTPPTQVSSLPSRNWYPPNGYRGGSSSF
jgi:phage gp36-like protein